MGKYRFLNSDEIIAEIEKFGTEDERDIVEKFKSELQDDDDDFNYQMDCEYCDEKDSAINNAINCLENEEISDADKVKTSLEYLEDV